MSDPTATDAAPPSSDVPATGRPVSAIEPDGTVAWRVAHSDVVTAVELVGGRLVLTSFAGQVSALDPVTGRATS